MEYCGKGAILIIGLFQTQNGGRAMQAQTTLQFVGETIAVILCVAGIAVAWWRWIIPRVTKCETCGKKTTSIIVRSKNPTENGRVKCSVCDRVKAVAYVGGLPLDYYKSNYGPFVVPKRQKRFVTAKTKKAF